MSEPVTRGGRERGDGSQVRRAERRAERGVVAGYIHELSRRHGAPRPEPRFEAAAEAGEAG